MSAFGAPVTQTVILAAGYGSRLTGLGGVPKPLIPVAGVPLIAHALTHARHSGCREAVVVVGHEAARVRSAIEQLDCGLSVRFVSVPDASEPNGASLLAAEPLAAPRFFLQMVDHVFSSPALPKLVALPFQPGEVGRVLVDCLPGVDFDLDDATKVGLDGDRVATIGKGLAQWDAIDAGCFVLTAGVFEALRRVEERAARTVSSGMRDLAASGSLGAVDLWEVEWVDVDTPADQAAAERLLSGVSSRSPRQSPPPPAHADTTTS